MLELGLLIGRILANTIRLRIVHIASTIWVNLAICSLISNIILGRMALDILLRVLSHLCPRLKVLLELVLIVLGVELLLIVLVCEYR